MMVAESRSEPVHILEFEVDGRSIDENGHVNNVEVVRWMQDAAVASAFPLVPAGDATSPTP